MSSPSSSPTPSSSNSFSSDLSSDSSHIWTPPLPLDSADLRRYSASVHAFTTKMWLDSRAEIERESQKKTSKLTTPSPRQRPSRNPFANW